MHDLSATKRIAVAAVLFGLVALVCFDVLSGDRTFCFRDTGHFYRPLYQYIQSEINAGRLPLWNSLENLGGPLAGNPTSAVFYPPKLIFFLPLDFGCLMNIYLIGHLLLAAAASYHFSRHVLRVGRTGATLAGMSYALAGPVLMQTCNVIYLVGAAWLPLALEMTYRTICEKSPKQSRLTATRNVVLLGLVLAMMILGGDPQMAYNVGLVAGLLVLICLWRQRRAGKTTNTNNTSTAAEAKSDPTNHRSPLKTAMRQFGLLLTAAAIALSLSAIQVLPSARWSAQSDRITETSVDRLLCRFEPGSHEKRVYEFSVGPWRWPELLWPGVSGRQYPEYRRWIDILPSEGRIWTSSLYQSVLILLLAFTTFGCFCRRRAITDKTANPKPIKPPTDIRVLWLQWIGILAVIASLGWYGIGWLLSELHINPGVGSPFGGLYWLMTVVLPGYAKFRYPAKLLIFVSFALATLGAVGWDRIERSAADRIERNRRVLGARPVRKWTRLLDIVTAISVFGMIVVWLLRPYFITIFAKLTPNILFGPFQPTKANTTILLALLQTAIVCFIAARCLWWRAKTSTSTSPDQTARLRHAQMLIVALVAADLIIAGRPLVITAPSEIWNRPSPVVEAIEQIDSSAPDSIGPPRRIYRSTYWLPGEWSHTSDPARIEKHIAWDHATLFPKYNLTTRLAMIDIQGAGRSQRFNEIATHPWSVDRFRKLGVSVAVTPPNIIIPDWEVIPLDVKDTKLWIDPKPTDRVWIESMGEKSNHRMKIGNASIVDWSPTRVEIEVSTDQSGRLVLTDQYDEDWRATVDGRPVKIEPVDKALRGVAVDETAKRVIFTYQPAAFYRGATISLIAWSLLLAATIALSAHRIFRRRAKSV